jgi:hypothetical protein
LTHQYILTYPSTLCDSAVFNFITVRYAVCISVQISAAKRTVVFCFGVVLCSTLNSSRRRPWPPHGAGTGTACMHVMLFACMHCFCIPFVFFLCWFVLVLVVSTPYSTLDPASSPMPAGLNKIDYLIKLYICVYVCMYVYLTNWHIPIDRRPADGPPRARTFIAHMINSVII